MCHDSGPSYNNLGPRSILILVNSKLIEVKTESTRDNIHSYMSIVQFVEIYIDKINSVFIHVYKIKFPLHV